jgi:hypothetical protein
MTRPWTLAESRLIAERVMEWEVAEHNGQLFFVDSTQRPDWLPILAIPDWPHDPTAAGMALAAIQMDGWRIEHSFWTAASHTFCVRLWNPIAHATAEGNAREWSESVMLAVLAAVEK